MKCRRARKLIYDFIDGMIGDQDRIALETHLGDCPSCEDMASGLSRSLDLLHRAPQAEVDDNFNWKVRLAIQQAKHSAGADVTYSRSWIRSWNLRFALSAVSTFVIVSATGYMLAKSNFSPRSSGLIATTFQSTNATTPSSVDNSGAPDYSGPGIPDGSFVGPTLTSTGSPDRATASSGLISEAPAINVDSLTSQFHKSRIAAEKLRRLEQQVDVLQSELHACESKD